MISEIHIKNFGIIESARVEFQEGFHILSGETGAGKSILVQAISFALGARSDNEAIRAGAEEASVSLVFEVKGLESVRARCRELEIDLSESEGRLILRRTINHLRQPI